MTGVLRRWLTRVERWVFYRLLRRTKQRRLARFFDLMQPRSTDRILDIGAGPGTFWTCFGDERVDRLELGAMDRDPVRPGPPYRWRLIADARRLPFRDGAFDVVFSNSVIEHVGDVEQQALMASEVRRVARRYFVQVPARSFPIEAHYMIPCFSYLPVTWQVAVTSRLFGIDEPIYLPTRTTVRRLFPEARVRHERLLGLTKAFIIYYP